MKRFITQKIIEWNKQNKKKALLIDGARQVGKTYSIREFAQAHYENFIEINLLENEDALNMFSKAKTSQEIFVYMSLLFGDKMIPDKTLIFLDEVQECLNIVTVIKFLVEDGRFRYILSGSLLGVEMKNVKSVPVGYMDILQMCPMNFAEFCIANGVAQSAIDYLKDCFTNLTPVGEAIHEKFMQLYRLYLVVGGMPDAVKEYIASNNLSKVLEIQRYLCENYKADMAKYEKENKPLLSTIFDLIPSELNAQNKRFKFKSIENGGRSKYAEDSFLWLTDAGIALPVYCANEPKAPLILSKSRNLLKLFLCDVGLLASMYINNLQVKILSGEKNINFGSVYENAVTQELVCHGLVPYYFNSHKQGELDLIVEIDGEAVQIEVKSGKDYTVHSALNNILNVEEYGVKKAYIFNNYNLSVDGNKVYLPVYMSMFLCNTEQGEMIYKLNLEELK